MVLDISIHERACQAFLEAFCRSEDMVFLKDDIIISEKKKIGDPVLSQWRPKKEMEIPRVRPAKHMCMAISLLCAWRVWGKDSRSRCILIITNISVTDYLNFGG